MKLPALPLVPVALVALAFAPILARADFVQIDLGDSTNADIRTYTGGSNYQVGGSTLVVGGVPFNLALNGGTANTLGVVQSGSDNASFSFNAPAGTYATSVYLLMNTAWGQFMAPQGTITVTGTLGEITTLQLIEGMNIRDHYGDGFVNTLMDPTVLATYFANGVASSTGSNEGSDRLDRQQILLPSTFDGDSIASISFTAANPGFPQGAPFLAAITLETSAPASVPDAPSLFTPLIAIFALTLGRLFQKRSR